MAKRGFLTRHGIKRNAIREDMLHFFIPWIFVMFAGLGVSAWDLVRRQGSLYESSAQNIVGLMLIVLGFTILLVAHITLWRNYSSTLVLDTPESVVM